MGRNRKYILRGRMALDIAWENGVDEMTFYKRLNRGWSVERAVLPTEKARKYRLEWECDGIVYDSYLQMVRELGCGYGTIRNAYYRNGSPFVYKGWHFTVRKVMF